MIPGWFDFADIYDESVRDARDGGVLVEVGCAFGKSTAHLAAAAARSGKGLTVYAVDPWGADDGWDGEHRAARAALGGAFSAFCHYMREAEALELVRPLRLESQAAAKVFDVASLDMVFIDAEHTYDALRADIDAWLPLVRPGGVLAGHDYVGAFQGVAQAVNEAFGGRHTVRGTSWWIRR